MPDTEDRASCFPVFEEGVASAESSPVRHLYRYYTPGLVFGFSEAVLHRDVSADMATTAKRIAHDERYVLLSKVTFEEIVEEALSEMHLCANYMTMNKASRFNITVPITEVERTPTRGGLNREWPRKVASNVCVAPRQPAPNTSERSNQDAIKSTVAYESSDSDCRKSLTDCVIRASIEKHEPGEFSAGVTSPASEALKDERRERVPVTYTSDVEVSPDLDRSPCASRRGTATKCSMTQDSESANCENTGPLRADPRCVARHARQSHSAKVDRRASLATAEHQPGRRRRPKSLSHCGDQADITAEDITDRDHDPVQKMKHMPFICLSRAKLETLVADLCAEMSHSEKKLADPSSRKNAMSRSTTPLQENNGLNNTPDGDGGKNTSKTSVIECSQCVDSNDSCNSNEGSEHESTDRPDTCIYTELTPEQSWAAMEKDKLLNIVESQFHRCDDDNKYDTGSRPSSPCHTRSPVQQRRDSKPEADNTGSAAVGVQEAAAISTSNCVQKQQGLIAMTQGDLVSALVEKELRNVDEHESRHHSSTACLSSKCKQQLTDNKGSGYQSRASRNKRNTTDKGRKRSSDSCSDSQASRNKSKKRTKINPAGKTQPLSSCSSHEDDISTVHSAGDEIEGCTIRADGGSPGGVACVAACTTARDEPRTRAKDESLVMAFQSSSDHVTPGSLANKDSNTATSDRDQRARRDSIGLSAMAEGCVAARAECDLEGGQCEQHTEYDCCSSSSGKRPVVEDASDRGPVHSATPVINSPLQLANNKRVPTDSSNNGERAEKPAQNNATATNYLANENNKNIHPNIDLDNNNMSRHDDKRRSSPLGWVVVSQAEVHNILENIISGENVQQRRRSSNNSICSDDHTEELPHTPSAVENPRDIISSPTGPDPHDKTIGQRSDGVVGFNKVCMSPPSADPAQHTTTGGHQLRDENVSNNNPSVGTGDPSDPPSECECNTGSTSVTSPDVQKETPGKFMKWKSSLLKRMSGEQCLPLSHSLASSQSDRGGRNDDSKTSQTPKERKQYTDKTRLSRRKAGAGRKR